MHAVNRAHKQTYSDTQTLAAHEPIDKYEDSIRHAHRRDTLSDINTEGTHFSTPTESGCDIRGLDVIQTKTRKRAHIHEHTQGLRAT